MEKKMGRSLQPLSKGLGTDSKKNQDALGGKPFPKGSRRREPPSGSNAPKNDPFRKPTPQRTKALDKRPRTRGAYVPPATFRGPPVFGTEEAGLIDHDEIELGSVFLPGSKKQSLNHLLNFVYAPREFENHRGGYEENAGKKGGRLMATRKHKYNKEQFLQANCQFIVNSSGDYKQYMNNPDALVEWNSIEQVNVQVSEAPSCPICLYPPVAGKMTRCGHIYCWSCILHYLSLSDKAWRKCPICYESVHKNDLKSVVSIPHHTFTTNETITFKLMKRQKGSLTAYPIDADFPLETTEKLYNMSESITTDIYSKLLLAQTSDVLSIIERESIELGKQLLEDENCPEKCFIEEAIELLKTRENCVLENIEEKSKENVGSVEEKLVGNASKIHYFYQASDGQHVYIHAINARMLEHTYGSLEFGPKTVTGKILEKEGGSMTEDLRKRLRYLQHLPVTCQFEVAEIQLKNPVVSKDTIEFFQDQIEIRRKRRAKSAREEKRREKRIAEEENRQLGKFPEVYMHLESHKQFPDFGSERTRTESENTLQSEGTSTSDTNISLPSSLSLDNEYAGPSFATMLATSKKSPILNASLNALKVSPTPPTKLINVTGAKVLSNIKVKNHSDSDVEIDGFEPVPEANRSFGDVIAQALQKASLNDAKNEGESSLGKKSKKKRNKQKVLFATSMAFSSGN